MKNLEDPLFSVRWNDRWKCVEVVWKGFVSGPPFRNCMEQGLALVRQKSARRFLGDFRGGSVMTEEDTTWLKGDWMPRARGAGLLHYAVVMPARVVAQLQLQRMKRDADQNPVLTQAGVQSMLFAEPQQAYAWLESLR